MGMWGIGVGTCRIRMEMMQMREVGVGMQGFRVGMRGIRVGMRGIRVGMRGIRVGMRGIRVGNEDDQGENLRLRVIMMNKKRGEGSK